MKHLALFAASILITSNSWADAPEPIHHDEGPYAVIEPPSRFLNPSTHPYVMGHQENRHVDPRSVAVCYQLTDNVVNEDFMKCRHGYDYKAWVPGHYIQ